MSGVGGIGGVGGIDRVMQLRAQILERNAALSRANDTPSGSPIGGATQSSPTSFVDTLQGALRDVNQTQQRAGELSAAYERGDTVDIARVMMARQEASVSFEATLQVRNKLLSAYRDIMSMPV